MQYSYDTIIIGAGLFGSVIARTLRAAGQTVFMIDSDHAARGSKPAACLMKPSWLRAFTKKQREEQFRHLDELYGLKELDFATAGGVKLKVPWVDPAKVLAEKRVIDHWHYISDGPGGWWLMCEKDVHIAKNLVIAAGVWTSEVLKKVANTDMKCLPVDVRALAGKALLFPEASLDQPFIKPWAPFKQIVAFNRGDGLWAGDGSSIIAKNWTGEKSEAVDRRCFDAVSARHSWAAGSWDSRVPLFGLRPYVKAMNGNPAYLREHFPGLWVATGGAKNGTMGAAWCALELKEKFT
jgi:glycine/D-amino acid oxidase-like deaminating enzyme